MRIPLRNLARRIAEEGAKLAREDFTHPTVNTRGDALPQHGTAAHDNGNEEFITQHPLIWGLDDWGDEESVLI